MTRPCRPHRAFASRQRDERNNNASPSPRPPSLPLPFPLPGRGHDRRTPELDGGSARGSPPRGHDRRPLRHHRRLPHRRGTLDHSREPTRAEAHKCLCAVYAASSAATSMPSRAATTPSASLSKRDRPCDSCTAKPSSKPRMSSPSAPTTERSSFSPPTPRETLSASILPSAQGRPRRISSVVSVNLARWSVDA